MSAFYPVPFLAHIHSLIHLFEREFSYSGLSTSYAPDNEVDIALDENRNEKVTASPKSKVLKPLKTRVASKGPSGGFQEERGDTQVQASQRWENMPGGRWAECPHVKFRCSRRGLCKQPGPGVDGHGRETRHGTQTPTPRAWNSGTGIYN